MNKKEVTGATREVKGKVEAAAGEVIGNEHMQAHGKVEELKGKATKTVGKIEKKVKTLKDDVKAKVHGATK